jgi:hypothetical protein
MTYLGWFLILWPFVALFTVPMVIVSGWRFAICLWAGFVTVIASLCFGMEMLIN